MPETDLNLMSLCIFLPTVFAVLLLFIPKSLTEYVRWFTLLGTACTFVVSMILFINYFHMLDFSPERFGVAAQNVDDAPRTRRSPKSPTYQGRRPAARRPDRPPAVDLASISTISSASTASAWR